MCSCNHSEFKQVHIGLMSVEWTLPVYLKMCIIGHYWSIVALARPGLKMACDLNGPSQVIGWVFFNVDFTIQNPIAPIFYW